MTTVAITADSGDGSIRGDNAVYATARSTSSVYETAADNVIVGQVTGYTVYRGYLKFDTSSIPAGATITQVYLSLTPIVDWSVTDFDIHIRKYDWSGQDPISDANREAAYDGLLAATIDVIWRNTLGIVLNTTYASPNMDTTWVNKGVGAATYYGLISSRDIAASTPTGDEYVAVATGDHATPGYRPILTVIYTPPTDISKVANVAYASIGKVAGVAIASVGKVSGLA